MLQDKSLNYLQYLSNLSVFARYLGFESYKDLACFLYRDAYSMQYRRFEVAKYNGKKRIISAPKKKLKDLQLKVLRLLEGFYDPPKSAHAFIHERSVVTNAKMHVGKKVVFTIDLKDFFGSIYFARVRNLLFSYPYSFPENVATVIAHICCYNGVLPQGAPTSPLISNMICWKLDMQLLALASKNRLTYTRYADDISFSSSVKLKRLSRVIAVIKDDCVEVGSVLNKIIEDNGFTVNNDKVRVRTRSERMEVTGLTVNDKLNVSKTFYKQLRSMLYAWGTYGYEDAEIEHHLKFYRKHRPSGELPSFMHIVHGKLLYMKMVKGAADKKYADCARQFNEYCPDESLHLGYFDQNEHWVGLRDEAMFVLEFDPENEGNEACGNQGTGFYVDNIGLITCDHVLPDENKVRYITCHNPHAFSKKYSMKLLKRCSHRDLAICKIYDGDQEFIPKYRFELASNSPAENEDVTLLGFPSYCIGASTSKQDGKITARYPRSALSFYEVSFQVRAGVSGGPVLSGDRSQVVGVAQKGASQDWGKNEILSVEDVHKLLEEI